MAMDGIAWGAKKLGSRRRRRKKMRADQAGTGDTVDGSLDEATQRNDRRESAADDRHRDSPYDESRERGE
jgi:hypothetical protein